MNGSEERLPNETTPDAILAELSRQQHLNPHRSLEQVLGRSGEVLGLCPEAWRAAVVWLKLDGLRAIGRLRRAELIQLARSLHRIERHAVAKA